MKQVMIQIIYVHDFTLLNKISELEQMLQKYPFWKLQTMFMLKIYDNQKAKEDLHQIYIQELLNYQEEEPIQKLCYLE